MARSTSPCYTMHTHVGKRLTMPLHLQFHKSRKNFRAQFGFPEKALDFKSPHCKLPALTSQGGRGASTLLIKSALSHKLPKDMEQKNRDDANRRQVLPREHLYGRLGQSETSGAYSTMYGHPPWSLPLLKRICMAVLAKGLRAILMALCIGQTLVTVD